jgi:hypothetical protein
MMGADVTSELNRLAKKHKGRLTPEIVIEAAKDPESPLHDQFDWDDDTAAHKWRLAQARALIRGSTLIVKTGETRTLLPAFVRDPDKPHHEQGYISTVKAKSDEDTVHAVLHEEFKRAAAILDRAKKLAAYFGMEDEVAEVEQQIYRLQEVAQERAQA